MWNEQSACKMNLFIDVYFSIIVPGMNIENTIRHYPCGLYLQRLKEL